MFFQTIVQVQIELWESKFNSGFSKGFVYSIVKVTLNPWLEPGIIQPAHKPKIEIRIFKVFKKDTWFGGIEDIRVGLCNANQGISDQFDIGSIGNAQIDADTVV